MLSSVGQHDQLVLCSVWLSTHCVQLSYSSPTLGLSGSYVREGVSKTFLSASTMTMIAPIVTIILGSKDAVEADDICASW